MTPQHDFVAPQPEEVAQVPVTLDDPIQVARSMLSDDVLRDALRAKHFMAMPPEQRDALVTLSHATPRVRATLEPTSALAALAMVRHGTPSQRDEASQLLRARPMPDDPAWVHDVLKVLAKDDLHEDPCDPLTLATSALDSGFWTLAALIAGLELTRRYAPWRAGDVTPRLLRACDRAAQEFPNKEADWLRLLADAALGGQLTYSWLERPVEACIRMSLGDPEREAQLRAFHDGRPYEANPERLEALYAHHFHELRRRGARRAVAYQSLLSEAYALADTRPTRAQGLIELLLAHASPNQRSGARAKRLLDALDHLDGDGARAPAPRLLMALYVRNIDVAPHAAHVVRSWHERAELTDMHLVTQADLDLYLMISDYERAFKHLTCKFDGVELEQSDKYAATRVKYFVEKRLKPGNVTRVVETLFAPVGWVGEHIPGLDLLTKAVDQGLQVFEARAFTHDLGDAVLLELRDNGAHVDTFDDVAQLPIDAIESVLGHRARKRILLGALAGGLSGGLAPLSWGVVSLADLPVLLGLCADICSRFCWHYGFDPREHPTLPVEILAVALGGAKPSAIQPMLLRQNFREFVLRKSLMVRALTTGAMRQVAGRAAHQAL
ncbi:MAG: hypothetical protein AAGI01_03370, partial [Myxococcota bacterium]